MSENITGAGDAVGQAGQASPTNMRHASDPLIGQTLDGRYKIERVLGEGGMGIVYKAVHTTLGKPLAIKVLRPEVSKNEEIVQRFRQEAQSASQIGNPHIIDISDFGTLTDGSTYFVMEFLGGKSLMAALCEDSFSTARSLNVVRQLAGALGAAHDIGIVHRDLKPDNVQLIARGGQKDFVKVLDFGIAKVGGSTSKLTQAGQVFGTPHYMSPEQCAGTHVDQRTDIYAVGVMLYEMVCGKVPFDADNLMGILTKHLYENPIAPREQTPPAAIAPELEAIVLKCLQKKPEARYQSMAELANDIDAIERGIAPQAVMVKVERAAAGPGTLTGVEARVGMGRSDPDVAIRKNRTPLFIGVGALAVVLLGVVMFVLPRAQAPAVSAAAKSVEPPVAAGASPEAPPAPQPTAAVVPAAPPAAPARPKPKAEINLRSHPEHAEVYRDGTLVGNAPLAIARPKQPIALELRLPGYGARQVELSPDSNDELTISLNQLEDRPVKPAAALHSPKHPHADAASKVRATKSRAAQTEVLDPWN
jgi:hypothetical protein